MSINKKIFIGYMVIFIITIIMGYFLGKYIFQGIYEHNKRTELRNQVSKLNIDTISTDMIKNLEKKLNVDIIAYDENNEYNIKNKFEHIIVSTAGEEYTVILDNLSDDLNEKISFHSGQQIVSIKGYKVFGGNYIIPVWISYDGKDYIDYEMDNVTGKFSKIESIELKDVKIQKISLRNMLEEDFLEMLLKIYVDNENFADNTQYTYDEANNEKEKFEIIVQNVDNIKVVLIYKYKNITDLFDELGVYFIFLLIIGLFLIVILTTLFTRMITNPVLKIKNITNKIIKLNFDEKLNIKNKDEIGDLAKDINNLADTLGGAMARLEEDKKNTKELMGNLSHEFKTPLTIISGYADLLTEEDNKKYLDIIIKEVDKLTFLVEETTKAISLDSKIVNLALEEFEMDELISDVIEKFQVNIPKNIKIEIYAEECHINADRQKMEQVIYNFVSNAIRHAESYVKIELKQTGKQKIFCVQNDGKQLKEYEKQKVWLKFFKFERESNEHGRAGLGLYITKSILELHGMKYGVENTNDGVVFYFIIEDMI